MDKLTIKVVNLAKMPLPAHAISEAAGMDAHANLVEAMESAPMGRALIPLG